MKMRTSLERFFWLFASQEQQQTCGTTTPVKKGGRRLIRDDRFVNSLRLRDMSKPMNNTIIVAAQRKTHLPLLTAAGKRILEAQVKAPATGVATPGHKRQRRPTDARARLILTNSRANLTEQHTFSKRTNRRSAAAPTSGGIMSAAGAESRAKESPATPKDIEGRRETCSRSLAKTDGLRGAEQLSSIVYSKKESLSDRVKTAFLCCWCVWAGWQLLCAHLEDEESNLARFFYSSSVEDLYVNFFNDVVNSGTASNGTDGSSGAKRDVGRCYMTKRSNSNPKVKYTGRGITKPKSRPRAECKKRRLSSPCGKSAKRGIATSAAVGSLERLRGYIPSFSFPFPLSAEAKPIHTSAGRKRRLEASVSQQRNEGGDNHEEQEETQQPQQHQQSQQSRYAIPPEQSREQAEGENNQLHSHDTKRQATQRSCYEVDPSSPIPYYVDLRAFARSRCSQAEPTLTGGFEIRGSAAAGSASSLATSATTGSPSTAAPAGAGSNTRSVPAAGGHVSSSADPAVASFVATVHGVLAGTEAAAAPVSRKEQEADNETALESNDNLKRGSTKFGDLSPVHPAHKGTPLHDSAASPAAPPHSHCAKTAVPALDRKTAAASGTSSATVAAPAAASVFGSTGNALGAGFAVQAAPDMLPPATTDASEETSAPPPVAYETAPLTASGEDIALQFLSVDWAALSALYRGTALHGNQTVFSAVEDATEDRNPLTGTPSAAFYTSSRYHSGTPDGISHENSAAQQTLQGPDENINSHNHSTAETDINEGQVPHSQSTLHRVLYDGTSSTNTMEQQQLVPLLSGDSAHTVENDSTSGNASGIPAHHATAAEDNRESRPLSVAAAFAAAAQAAEAAAETPSPQTSVRYNSSTRQLLHPTNEDENNQEMLVEPPPKGGAVALLRCVVKQKGLPNDNKLVSGMSWHISQNQQGVDAEAKESLFLPHREAAIHDQQEQQHGEKAQPRLLLRSHGIEALEPVILVPAPAQVQRQLAFKLRLHRQQRDVHNETLEEKDHREVPYTEQQSTTDSGTPTHDPDTNPLPALLQIVVPFERSRIAAAWLRRVLLGPGVVARRWEAATLSGVTSTRTCSASAASGAGFSSSASAVPSEATSADQRASGPEERQHAWTRGLPAFAAQREEKKAEETPVSFQDQRFPAIHQTSSLWEHGQQRKHDKEENSNRNEDNKQKVVLQLPVLLVEIPLRDVVEAWLPQRKEEHKRLEGSQMNDIQQGARAAASNELTEEQGGEAEEEPEVKIHRVLKNLSFDTGAIKMEEEPPAPARELEATAARTSTEQELEERASTMNTETGKSARIVLHPGQDEGMGVEYVPASSPWRRQLQLLEWQRAAPYVMQLLQRYILSRYRRVTAAPFKASTARFHKEDVENQRPLSEDAEVNPQQQQRSSSQTSIQDKRERQRCSGRQEKHRQHLGFEKRSYAKISAFPHPSWAPHTSNNQSNLRSSYMSRGSGESLKGGFMMAQLYVGGFQLRCALLHSLNGRCPSAYDSPKAPAAAVQRSIFENIALRGCSYPNGVAAPLPPARRILPRIVVDEFAAGTSIATGRTHEQKGPAVGEAASYDTEDSPAVAMEEYSVGRTMPQTSVRKEGPLLPHGVVLVQHTHADENSDEITYALTCHGPLTTAPNAQPGAEEVVSEGEARSQQQKARGKEAGEESCGESVYQVPVVPVSEEHLSALPRTRYC